MPIGIIENINEKNNKPTISFILRKKLKLYKPSSRKNTVAVKNKLVMINKRQTPCVLKRLFFVFMIFNFIYDY